MLEALRYPIRGEHAEKALLAAWICVLAHAILLPFVALVPLLGYAASVLAAEDDEPPPFLEREVLERGLGATVLTLCYGVVPVGIALVTFRLLAATDREPTGGDALVVLGGSTAVLFALAAFAYLLPIALGNYARSGSLRAGFRDLGTNASHADYFVGWSSGIVLFLVGLAISSALAALDGLPTVFGSFVGAYAVLAAARRIGRGYAASRRGQRS